MCLLFSSCGGYEERRYEVPLGISNYDVISIAFALILAIAKCIGVKEESRRSDGHVPARRSKKVTIIYASGR
jgi:hypothetical protein